MARYFYTDPIAAAWMVRHHDMKVMAEVTTGNGKREQKPIPLWAWGRVIENWAMSAYEERFYISPESLPILEPKAGDVVQFGDDHFGVFIEPEPEYRPNFSGIRIIERNGVAFHWPQKESEEA